MLGSKSRWLDANWLENALAWVDARLAETGSKRTGSVEQPHLTAWATVVRIPTTEGDVYFKAVSPAYRFEISLTAYLAQEWPNLAPRLLASDPQQGWLIMRDGGSRLRELLKAEPDIDRWKVVLGLYAHLQQQTMSHATRLLELGTPDRRLPVLTQRFDEFLEDPDRLMGEELTQGDVERLIAARPQIVQCAHELSGLGIGACLDHGDFHDGNIFVDREAYVFFDWGDAGLTHPFFSLRTAFVSLENSLGLEENDPIFDRLSDYYLNHWARWDRLEVLRRAYLVSRPLASINAAVRWRCAIDDLDRSDQAQYQSVVPSLLSEVLMGLRDL